MKQCSINETVDVVSYLSVNEFENEWYEIPGFSKYQASSIGVIRNKKTGRFLKPMEVSTSVGTYLRVSVVSDDWRYRAKEAHHLVCLAFHGIPPDGGYRYEVNHKDGNKHNNHPSNLEWTTRGENLTHAYATGLRKENAKVYAYDHVEKKETMYYSVGEFARQWGCSWSTAKTLISRFREKKYQGRYTFRLDISQRKVAKHEWTKDIIFKDYVTNTQSIVTDSTAAELLTGVKAMTVLWNIRNRKSNLVGGYVFKYHDDKDPFPEYSAEEALTSRQKLKNAKVHKEKRFGVQVKDYVTGEVTEYSRIQDAALAIGMPKGSLSAILQNEDYRLRKGKVFRYADNETPFPDYPQEYVMVSLRIKKIEFPPIYGTDHLTNTTKLYASIKEFADDVGVNNQAMVSCIGSDRSKRYKGRYSVKVATFTSTS